MEAEFMSCFLPAFDKLDVHWTIIILGIKKVLIESVTVLFWAFKTLLISWLIVRYYSLYYSKWVSESECVWECAIAR